MKPLKPASLTALILSSLFAFGAAAQAESLGEKKKWKEQDEYMKSSIDGANSACGTRISFKFDKPTFKSMPAANSPYGMCSSVMDALASFCGDPDSKAEVAKKVSSVNCKFAGKGKRSLTLKGGTLTYAIDVDAANFDDYFKEVMNKAL